jgi:hypothetical protein
MKNVTDRYRRAIVKNREFLYEAKITFADGSRIVLNDKDDLMGDGISIAAGTSGTDSFDIGAAVMGELTMTLNNSTEKFSTYNFLDAQINLKIGLKLEDTAEYLQMGVYTVEEAETSEMVITLSALDNMSRLEAKKYSEVDSVYPKKECEIIRDICACCGIVFLEETFPNGDRVICNRPSDTELNCLQMISFVAQISGNYAVMDGNGRLTFHWYDTSVFERMDSLDGGRLKNAATGDDADGGNFTDYNSGGTADGGTFEDQKRYAHIYAMGSMKVATDEIVITGVRVAAYEEETGDLEEWEELDDSEEREEKLEEGTEADGDENAGILYGEEGYVLFIGENPLIAKEMEGNIAREVGNKVIGMKVRTFSVSALSDPAIEAGDCAYISDRKGNSYPVYITNTVFKLGNYEEFSCGAQSPGKNRAGHTSEATKAIIRAREEIKKQFTAYDAVVQQLTELMANSFGVFKTEEKQPDGSIIYYMHDKPSVNESKTIWKMVSGAIAVSTDGGKTWNAGVTAEGNMIAKVLSAIGINADWINVGEISSATINIGEKSFTVDEKGNVKITKGSINIGDGSFRVDDEGNMYAQNAEIEGGITGINGFQLAYQNTMTYPPTYKRFNFAKVSQNSTDGIHLHICAPSGESCIEIGMRSVAAGVFGEDSSDEPSSIPNLGTESERKNIAYFPNGAGINGAVIENLVQTFTESKRAGDSLLSRDWIDLEIKVSGAFICVYGAYHTYEQKAGETKEIIIGNKKSPYIPTCAPVRAVGALGKRIFVFRIDTNGKFTARNSSEQDYNSESAAEIKFRFDFFRI